MKNIPFRSRPIAENVVNDVCAGSDWNEWRVRDVETGKDMPDLIKWVKFSGASWTKDGKGFFYSRYDEPKPGKSLEDAMKAVFDTILRTAIETFTSASSRANSTGWTLVRSAI